MDSAPGKYKSEARSRAPGRIKISEAVLELLREKAYHEITWGEIARTAGVSEALIYQHFKDRNGLLCSLLEELLTIYVQELGQALHGIYGALNKLHQVIYSHVNSLNRDRVFAKILLLEIRSNPRYFESGAYRIVRNYGDMILDIIKEGVYYGEIRNDAAPEDIRQIVLGTIEHICLPYVVFGREFSPDDLADRACRIIFSGIEADNSTAS